MTAMPRCVLIVAGGTGGHIYPALAVADYLKQHDVQTIWLGSRRGLETRLVPAAGIRLITIAVAGLRGRGMSGWLLAPFALTLALTQALIAVARTRPRLVLGMGGFVSGPGGLAAWLCRRPLVIHEQNAIPGLTNTFLSRIATKIFQGFPGAFPEAIGATTVGNPVRESIVSIPSPERRGLESSRFRILILGGSRGAKALNEAVPRAIAGLQLGDIEVWHQAGDGNAAATRPAYAELGDVAVRVTDFIDDMAAAYTWASIVVCRAGALTVCELTNAGAAAILVPFPYAVDDHQTANAKILVEADAASLVSEGPHFVERLKDELQHLAGDRKRLLRMALGARQLAIPDAATRVGTYCLEHLDG